VVCEGAGRGFGMSDRGRRVNEPPQALSAIRRRTIRPRRPSRMGARSPAERFPRFVVLCLPALLKPCIPSLAPLFDRSPGVAPANPFHRRSACCRRPATSRSASNKWLNDRGASATCLSGPKRSTIDLFDLSQVYVGSNGCCSTATSSLYSGTLGCIRAAALEANSLILHGG